MDAAYLVAVNSGRLWLEGLSKLCDGTEFVLHPAPLDVSRNPRQLGDVEPRTIFIYREKGFAGAAGEWIRLMRQAATSAKIVVIAPELRLDAYRDAMNAGADGYLTDDISGRVFVQMLSLVLEGEKVAPSALATAIAGSSESDAESATSSLATSLSRNESDVLRLLTRGKSNKQIANQLMLSESTIKGRVKSVLRKIHASNRTQAAAWAITNGLGTVDLEEARCAA